MQPAHTRARDPPSPRRTTVTSGEDIRSHTQARIFDHSASPHSQRGFVHGFTLLLSDTPLLRRDELCVTLRLNLANSVIASFSLLSDMAPDAARIWLRGVCGGAVADSTKLRTLPGSGKTTTYAELLRAALTPLPSPEPALRLVVHADIVVGNWSCLSAPCIHELDQKHVSLHLTRSEPRHCFPASDGHARIQQGRAAVDKIVYSNLCDAARCKE